MQQRRSIHGGPVGYRVPKEFYKLTIMKSRPFQENVERVRK
jgi:hypothetical protein